MAETLSKTSQPTLLQTQFPSPEALALVPEELARRYNAIPVAVRGNTLLVAMADPGDVSALQALALQSRRRIEPHPAPAEEIQEAIDLNYHSYEKIEEKVSSIALPEDDDIRERLTSVTDAPVAEALGLIIEEAVKSRASDVHFHPQEDRLWLRFRVDGTLRDVLSLPLAMGTPLISRIKIMANMNIADHHHTQDGQFTFKAGRHLVDVRVGTMPTIHGEMAVLRLLDKSRWHLDLSALGFLPDVLNRYRQMLEVPYGMILVSGPTGAGKTTTLYASINALDRDEKNIITIEDPVEYRFKKINQVQVNNRSGLTFSAGLRAILRLDPDVILVGEIRDAETAQIAVQGALTGHLVLSSIHANDALTVVSRLLDLGVEPFLVSSALIGIVAQRMVRRVCPHCARPAPASLIEQMVYERETGEKRTEFHYGQGCRACSETGYLGRTGVFEVLSLNDELRAMLVAGADIAELRQKALASGMVPLLKDGMLKAGSGITTPAEVLKNVHLVE